MSEETNRNLARILILADWDWNSPEEVHDKWLRKDKEAIGPFLEGLYPDCDTKKIANLYFNYGYLEDQIFPFVASDCFAYDKTRWILKQYFESLVGGIPDSIPNDFPESRRTYHPEFGMTDDWMMFVEAMQDLHANGLNDKNMKAMVRMRKLHEEYLNR